jgi:senataxin
LTIHYTLPLLFTSTVLIDEAGQSSEVAALQPLAFGARQVVLVGDPQQLPATILSEAAKAAALERSLFERLQSQGCPVMMLTVQYRMDPDIRSFPSRYFYHNRLEDASAIKARTPAPYHSRRLLGHYMVFDVARGQERRGQQSGSLSNAAEAEFAVCLVLELRRAMQEAAAAAAAVGHQPPSYPSVAVITPYREQRKLLQETFTIMCGKEVAKTVTIQTIDSYQGRQVDVVLLSCVRAGNGAGLGFVNDVRRMNVAITRAKRSLWVLGAVETLKASKHWDELIR